MSKSSSTGAGIIEITDSPEDIERKIRRAVTDTDDEVRYDPEKKPGISNLLELLGAAEGVPPATLASRYTTYGALKKDTAQALIELLRPVRERVLELSKDPAGVMEVLHKGATKANVVANRTYLRARNAVGLIEPTL
jgi:tryptophanyl-tRNA synthetase